MQTILYIAGTVIRENLRRRTLYVVLLFAFALLMTIESLSRFEAELQIKMVKDFSYTIISIFGLILAVLLTIDQIQAEIDSRTIYLILTRPISRKAYILGKFAGILGTLTGIMVLLGVILAALTAFATPDQRIPLDLQLFQALVLLEVKYAVLISLLLFLSLVSSRAIAISLALLAYGFGHVSEVTQSSLSGSSLPVLPWVFDGIRLILPNFNLFDVSSSILVHEVYSFQAMALLAGYGGSFVFFYLLLAHWVFASKDL